MDKKKVKELICKAKNVIYCAGDNTLLDYERTKILSKANKLLDDAVKELSKSDWVSVEDELPPYNERVFVCSKENSWDIYISYRVAYTDYNVDSNGFIRDKYNNKITHWKSIEKLEE